ncbi:MAG: hypothetical protein J0I32_04405 [Sphingobacteriales bacterium]|nr:hypothetical protein [Sphingobacteriales bacterium]OJV98400.1 MAG: hypothetical protein BGO52_11470 [Sphingobacteriales bacterium 44-61]
MSNKNIKIDAIDEALKFAYLNADTDQTNTINPSDQISYIINAAYPVQLSDELSTKMIDKLYEKLAVDSLGILLTNAIKDGGTKVEDLATEVSLPAITIEQLKEDAILANSIPVISFRNLVKKLQIPFGKVEQAINKTFHMLKNEAAFSPAAISSLQLSYRRRNTKTASSLNTKASKSERQYLFQNEEALNKYLKRLGELYESK